MNIEKHAALLCQLQLHGEGFYHGALDGQWGPITQAAYEAFKKANPVIQVTRTAPPAPATKVSVPEDQKALQEDAGGMVFDARSERNLKTLTPAAERQARKWLAACRESGLNVVVICGTRTFAEQAQIYAQGRTSPGPIVTHAKPGSSFHNFGCAWDFVIFPQVGPAGGIGEPQWGSPDMTKAGMIAESQGLVWGGHFKSPVDTPHVQTLPVGDLALLRSKMPTGWVPA